MPRHSTTRSTARRAGIEPAVSGFGDQRSTVGADGASIHHSSFRIHHFQTCVGKDSNLRWARRAGRVTVCHLRPLGHLRVSKWPVVGCQWSVKNKFTGHRPLATDHSPSISVEGFEPSTPCARGTCAAKLRYTLFNTPGGTRTLARRLKTGSPAVRRRERDHLRFSICDSRLTECSRRGSNPHFSG